MKVIITGADGILGSTLAEGLFGGSQKHQLFAMNRLSMDVTDRKSVQSAFESVSPDVLIHCAAMTNVDLSEKEPSLAQKINVQGTQNVVEFAQKHKTFVIYISSTGNYGAYKDEPYTEKDDCLPTTVYHKTKFEGENVVLENLEKALVLRTGWLFGGHASHVKNFVYRRYLEAKQNPSIKSDPYQKGNPTSVHNLSRQIEKLINEKISGIFNVVDHGAVSRFEYVKRIIKEFGLPTQLIEASFTRIAPVSPNESAINENLKNRGLDLMEPWEDSLSRYIKKLMKELNV